jgi:hypothetical protein
MWKLLFEFSVNKDMQNKKQKGQLSNSTYLLAYLLTLIVKKLKISAEHGKVVTTLVIIKH